MRTIPDARPARKPLAAHSSKGGNRATKGELKARQRPAAQSCYGCCPIGPCASSAGSGVRVAGRSSSRSRKPPPDDDWSTDARDTTDLTAVLQTTLGPAPLRVDLPARLGSAAGLPSRTRRVGAERPPRATCESAAWPAWAAAASEASARRCAARPGKERRADEARRVSGRPFLRGVWGLEGPRVGRPLPSVKRPSLASAVWPVQIKV